MLSDSFSSPDCISEFLNALLLSRRSKYIATKGGVIKGCKIGKVSTKFKCPGIWIWMLADRQGFYIYIISSNVEMVRERCSQSGRTCSFNSMIDSSTL